MEPDFGTRPLSKTHSDSGESDPSIMLGLLTAVEQESAVTQRTLASDLGIALGMANAYLKRCVRKGLIKVKQAPANRYRYYLTPKGFSEKAHLTAEYLTSSFTFFRRAKDQCVAELDGFAAEGKLRIAMAGVSELAEIAALCQLESTIELVGIVDPDSRLTRFAGIDVVDSVAALDDPVDGVLVTDVRKASDVYARMVETLGAANVRAPRLLGLERIKTDGRS